MHTHLYLQSKYLAIAVLQLNVDILLVTSYRTEIYFAGHPMDTNLSQSLVE